MDGKPYQNPNAYCTILKDKGITFKDRNNAEKHLSTVSTLKLMTPYKKVLNIKKDNNERHIYNEITFEIFEIMFDLDREVTQLFLETIIRIEIIIKTAIINAVGDELIIEKGVVKSDFDFLETVNYIRSATKKIKNNYFDLENGLKGWEKRNTNKRKIKIDTSYPYKYNVIDNSKRNVFNYKNLNHHYNKYGNIPFWFYINDLQWGELTRLLQYFDKSIGTRINNVFTNKLNVLENNKDFIKLKGIISDLGRYRNWFAHGNSVATIIESDIRLKKKVIHISDFLEKIKMISENEHLKLEQKLKNLFNSDFNRFVIYELNLKNDNTALNQLIKIYG